MTDDPIKHSSETAYRLETPDQHRTFYDDWAESYDSGFAASKGYDYPRLIAEYFVGRVSPDQSPVLDIGCGTGLVGVSLREEGWSSKLTGVDISQGMLEVAERKKVYEKLICADLSDTLQLPQSHFGGMISAGTFTHGHLGPEVLFHLFSLARPGAHAVIGINAEHHGNQDFSGAFWEWEEKGIVGKTEWTEIQIYQAPEGKEPEKKLALIVDFRIL